MPLDLHPQDWTVPSGTPSLSEKDAHVWLANTADWSAHVDRLRAFLSHAERERAARFRLPAHQARSVVTRGLTRLLLGRYTGSDPALLEFTYGPQGKPLVCACDVRFNASHSGDIILLGFSRAAAVGIDVERIRRDMPRQKEIAEKHFAPGELAQFEALPEGERVDAFFRCWSRKEAYIKMRGDGIFAGLQTFEVSVSRDSARLLSPHATEDLKTCWLSRLPEIPNYESALCLASAPNALDCYLAEPKNI